MSCCVIGASTAQERPFVTKYACYNVECEGFVPGRGSCKHAIDVGTNACTSSGNQIWQSVHHCTIAESRGLGPVPVQITCHARPAWHGMRGDHYKQDVGREAHYDCKA